MPQEKIMSSQDKGRVTVVLPGDLLDRIRNAVYWTPGMTLTDFAISAFTEEVGRMEKDRRKPFPSRKRELRPGRPMKDA